MSKVELHVHFEGSIRPATLLSLAKKNGVSLPADDEAGVRRWLHFREPERLLEIRRACCRCLRDPEDFQLGALDFLAEQAVQNVVYSEVHLDISTHASNGVDPVGVRAALLAAAREGERRYGIKMRLIPHIVRDADLASADLTLDWALSGNDRLIVALGLSGREDRAIEPFRQHFQQAAQAGLRRVAIAGERGGAESVRAVLEVCGAERIGHGVRAVEDVGVLGDIIERDIPLAICPTSNVRLGVARDLTGHPFDYLYKSGANVSINSDGP